MPIKLARPEILQQLPGCPVAVSICLAGDKTFRTDVAEVSMFSVIFGFKSKDGPRQQEKKDAGLI